MFCSHRCVLWLLRFGGCQTHISNPPIRTGIMVHSAGARWLGCAVLWKSGSARGETELLPEISVPDFQRVREESRAVSLDPFTMTMYKGKRRHHRCKFSSDRELCRFNVWGERDGGMNLCSVYSLPVWTPEMLMQHCGSSHLGESMQHLFIYLFFNIICAWHMKYWWILIGLGSVLLWLACILALDSKCLLI